MKRCQSCGRHNTDSSPLLCVLQGSLAKLFRLCRSCSSARLERRRHVVVLLTIVSLGVVSIAALGRWEPVRRLVTGERSGRPTAVASSRLPRRQTVRAPASRTVRVSWPGRISSSVRTMWSMTIGFRLAFQRWSTVKRWRRLRVSTARPWRPDRAVSVMPVRRCACEPRRTSSNSRHLRRISPSTMLRPIAPPGALSAVGWAARAIGRRLRVNST